MTRKKAHNRDFNLQSQCMYYSWNNIFGAQKCFIIRKSPPSPPSLAIHALAHIKEPRVHITAVKMSPRKDINKKRQRRRKKTHTHTITPQKQHFHFKIALIIFFWDLSDGSTKLKKERQKLSFSIYEVHAKQFSIVQATHSLSHWLRQTINEKKSKLNIVSFYLFAYYNRHYNALHCGPVFTIYGENFISSWIFFLSLPRSRFLSLKKAKGDEIDLDFFLSSNQHPGKNAQVVSDFWLVDLHFDSPIVIQLHLILLFSFKLLIFCFVSIFVPLFPVLIRCVEM